MKLINMEMSEEERQEEVGETPRHAQPKYPWGLELCLNDEVIEKLGIEGLPKPGTEIMIQAKCVVTGIRASEVIGPESEASITLQITDMGIEEEDPKYAQKIYDKT